jgi:NAD(P) transhydrogenase subunit alpha
MSSLTPEQALEQARAQARAAQSAADAAQAAAEQIAVAASAATHGAVDPTVFRLAIFVMAIFVGYYVVWSVTPALHTPLMSVTNAISSVIVVGALLAVTVRYAPGLGSGPVVARIMGFLGLILASINIFGGMLAMYRRKD